MFSDPNFIPYGFFLVLGPIFLSLRARLYANMVVMIAALVEWYLLPSNDEG